ncbi:MAG: RDD family protein [Acidobacteria bacterium]|nr:RDD family protein [Acidobacteriota bacterium]MCA1619794.1 RDD family protein [Acidobacteriota bacterium]
MSAVEPTEETLVIETPERVPLHFALASTGNRFLACAFDHFLQLVLIAVVALFVIWWIGFSDLGRWVTNAPKWLLALLVVAVFLIWSGYFVLFEWAWSGQTPGKRRLRLRVIREDGRPVTFWEAAARNLVRLLDMMPWFVIPFYSVGLVSVFVSSRDQRLGDLVAGTVVVREREAQAPSFEQVFSAPTADAALRRSFKAVAFRADVNLLSAREVEVVEAFLRRRWDMEEMPRQWMAWRIATPILYRLRPEYDLAEFTYEGFLEELLHRYRATHRFTD